MDLRRLALKAVGETRGPDRTPCFEFASHEPPVVHLVPLRDISQLEYLDRRGHTIITVCYFLGKEQSFGVEPAAVEPFRRAVQQYNPQFR